MLPVFLFNDFIKIIFKNTQLEFLLAQNIDKTLVNCLQLKNRLKLKYIDIISKVVTFTQLKHANL